MNLREEIIMYKDVRASDGAGGTTTTRTKVADLYADVKPMTGHMAMTFQQITGSQGYTVWVRTDFNRVIDTTYTLDWQGIHDTLTLAVNSVEMGLKFTKLICKNENRVTA